MKLFKKLSAMALALLMLLTLASCGDTADTTDTDSNDKGSSSIAESQNDSSADDTDSEEDAGSEDDSAIAGTWQAEIGLADFLETNLGYSLSISAIAEVEFADGVANITLTASQDNREEVKEEFIQVMYASYVEGGGDLSLEDYIAAGATTGIDENIDSMYTSLDKEVSGNYTYADGVLEFEKFALQIEVADDVLSVVGFELYEEDADPSNIMGLIFTSSDFVKVN